MARIIPFPTIRKAAIAGGAAGDLFAAPVQVAGHMRGGHFVAPYQGTRNKSLHAPAQSTVGNLTVHWPDEAHARLFHMGQAVRARLAPDPAEVARLWEHFRGHIEHERERPFSKPEHVIEAALDYADPEWGEAALMGHQSERGHYMAGDIVSTDTRGDYYRRGTTQGFAKAQAMGRRFILWKAP